MGGESGRGVLPHVRRRTPRGRHRSPTLHNGHAGKVAGAKPTLHNGHAGKITGV